MTRPWLHGAARVVGAARLAIGIAAFCAFGPSAFAVTAFAVAAFAVTAQPANPEDPGPKLEDRHREFLEMVAPLIGPEERRVFLALADDYRRDEFVRRFWQTRDPYPETARNEFLDRFEQNLEQARERFPDLDDERARFMIAYGPPDRSFRSQCELLESLEIWHYPRNEVLRSEFFVTFIRRGARFRRWLPSLGIRSLLLFSSALDERAALEEITDGCGRGDDIIAALVSSPDWERLEAEGGLFPRPNPEWATSFFARSTAVPEGAELLSGSLRVDYPGRHQSRTVVQAQVELAAGDWIADRQETGPLHLVLDGEVVREGQLFETFRYKFEQPAPAQGDLSPVPVMIERYLRPGAYDLVLRLQDLDSRRYLRLAERLDVPSQQPQGAAARVAAQERVAAVAVGEAGEDSESAAPVIRLQVPNDELLIGRVRIAAFADGPGISRVRFDLDEKALVSKARRPYELEVDLGRAPQLHRLRAVALDAVGGELADDEVTLNSGPHRFSIRLIEPRPGGSYHELVRASAEVEVPRAEALDRVEFYLNDTRVATLYQPPFVQPIPIPRDQRLAYVRALGVLESGSAVEDVVFVNAPDLVDNVDVHFVELYTSVLDSRGRPAEDVAVTELKVLEDGVEQRIFRFERVRDLPIHAGILLDTSMSMIDRLEEAEEAALHFLNRVLTERDRACLVTFNDRHQLVVPFTNRTEVLAGGLAGLVAEGETSLYDSLIHTLFQFNGIRGKRALILLSDGADSNSRYQFDEVLDYARRSGVALYTIGLGIPLRDVEVRAKLTRLCNETGGRCFFIEHANELKTVYGSIEQELRAQYLIAYQSTAPANADEFREIEVKVARRGLKAHTLSGYYP